MSPDPLPRAARDLLERPEELVGRVLEDIRDALPGLAGDPRLRQLLLTTVRDTIVAGLTVLAGGTPAPGADARAAGVPLGLTAPPAGLEMARRLAQHDVPITAMLRGYRLGQARFQHELIARLAAGEITAGQLAAAATALSSVAFSVVDQISEQLVAVYQSERDDWMRRRNAARLAKVMSVLASDTGDTERGVESALGYGLAGCHVAAVLWCGPEIDEPARPGVLERHVGPVAEALGCARPPLAVAPDATTLWAWFPATQASPEAVAEVIGRTPGVFAALGGPGRGPGGFRLSHRQARRAQVVALAAGPGHRPPVTAAARLGPLTLLALDGPAAGDWVRSVLGGLAADDEPHARLRDTLWSYLSSGSSLAAAAAELHLHKNTIQYRIRRAEEALGRPLHDARLEVEVALLAWRLLGPSVLAPATHPDA